MPGRQYSSNTYRYGFNGKEKDDEINVNGGEYNFDARLYDSRLGRWLSVDPQASKAPNMSPYLYSFNSPISYNDPDGEWAEVHTKKFYRAKDGVTLIEKTKFLDIFKKTVKIEREIVIHNAKLYYDASNKNTVTHDQKEAMAKIIENDVVDTWKKSPDYDETKKKNVEVVVKVAFEGGIQVIDDLKNIKSSGKKSDHLFIIADDEVIGKMGTILKTDDAAGLNYGHLTILSQSQGLRKRTSAHEIGHGGGLSDNNTETGYLMDEGKTDPSDQEKLNFYKGGDKANGFKLKLNKYERAKRK